ncbi:MAG TPA: rhodanese-like domain-containing protein [Thermoanaerobaculia bacterium]|nr:rhodanese-like domain-containing protein [Thermoanaerobaculia bacterium]
MRRKNRKGIAWTVAAAAALTFFGGWAATRSARKSDLPPAVTRPDSEEQAISAVPRIGVADAKAWIASGSVVVIDVRDAESYLHAHIPGALHIPLSRLEGEIPYLQRSRPILTYCT